MKHSWYVFTLSGLLVSAAPARGVVTPPPTEKSLTTCQNAVKTEGDTFEKNWATAVGTCLQKVASELIQNQALDTTKAASICVTQFRNIYDSRGTGKSLVEKLAANIRKKCEPGMANVTHELQDVTGKATGLVAPQLDTKNIDAWCTTFGGDGDIGTVQEWVDCVAAAHKCAANAAISTQYPRALEWLAAVRVKMNALPRPTTGDTTKIDNARAGLDAVAAAIDGPDHDGVPSIQCGNNGQLATCQTDLTTCDSQVVTCSSSLTTCNGHLGTVNAGTAAAGDVLSGKTFSSSAGLGVTGAMPNNGAVNITPGTLPQTIAAGYHNGAGSVAGDSDLVAENIVSGVSIFGVTGTAGVVPAQPLKTGQTASYIAGDDGDVEKGVARQYVDNGDGTITDTRTGLMWEKLSYDGSVLHDYRAQYTWYTAFTTKIMLLNLGFAGHTDWRLPNLFELETLVDIGHYNLAMNPVFDTNCTAGCTVLTCSCTQANYYWSSSTYESNPSYAWFVNSVVGSVDSILKTDSRAVRAVRGGL